MPLSPRTLRPSSSAIHKEAAAWKTAVVSNGGSVSGSTLKAVSKFCRDIDAAGLRGIFYRLNLFAGTGLNAALVPLYRGPSSSGTQYGNTVDTNVGPFVSGDYSESSGLQGNGTSKYLQTGFPGNTVLAGNRHQSAYEIARDPNAYRLLMGVQDDAGGTYYWTLGNGAAATTTSASFYFSVSSTNNTVGGHWVASDAASNYFGLYKNGVISASSANTTKATANARTVLVFASNTNPNSVAPGNYTAARMGGYSIGLGMSASQAAAYYTAMQALQTALARNV